MTGKTQERLLYLISPIGLIALWQLLLMAGIGDRRFVPAPSDIAWLKLNVISQHGSGVLTGVTTVQRINTQGGQLAGACDKAGATKSAPYSAEYVFLRKG